MSIGIKEEQIDLTLFEGLEGVDRYLGGLPNVGDEVLRDALGQVYCKLAELDVRNTSTVEASQRRDQRAVEILSLLACRHRAEAQFANLTSSINEQKPPYFANL